MTGQYDVCRKHGHDWLKPYIFPDPPKDVVFTCAVCGKQKVVKDKEEPDVSTA